MTRTTDLVQKRIVVYYQTHHHDNGSLVSTRELQRRCPELTAVMLGATHVNERPGDISLNDDPADAPGNDGMWADLFELQRNGGLVIGMLGGAAVGSYERLDGEKFDSYYPHLRSFIQRFHLDGIDLDVEEEMSLDGVVRLIDALRHDFGATFTITMAPVATALSGGGNMSGFDYEDLYRLRGAEIAWVNAQFYCGWGSLESIAGYQAIIERGIYPANKVVAGTISQEFHGAGYVEFERLEATVRELVSSYPDFGGLSAWEYFDSVPGGETAPWEWAQRLALALATQN